MNKFYKLNCLGIERDLPVLKAPSGIDIAGFNSVGDMELLLKSAQFLAQKISENNIKCDVILTTELKGVPIAQEVARLLNKDYVCLRKQPKCYMLNPVNIKSESITSGKTEYFVSEPFFNKLVGNNVVFVDDVFSTGATFENILRFSKESNFNISAGLCILREVPKNKLNESTDFEFKDTMVYTCALLPLP
ncbi:MAG: hypothetical protein IJX17_03275 [Clostridia bacterium]|nr:hypothetical protein [Clostridia bacterium]